MPALVAGISLRQALPCHPKRDHRDKPGDDSARCVCVSPCAGHPRLHGLPAIKTWMAGTSPAMTCARPIHLFNCQTASLAHWASSIARIFFGAGSADVSLVPRKKRGRWRARWRNHCSFDAALPLENAGASWRAIAGVFPTAPGRALREPSVLPAPASPIGEGAGGRYRPPNGQAPGGQLVLAAGRSPGAARVREVAFPPGRGRRIRSHPHDAS